MRLAIDKKDLTKHIQHLASIVPGKNTTPILTNYLIDVDAESNSIRITASDLEITAIVSFPASVSEGGSIAVSARHFNEIINSMPEDVISIWKNEDLLVIQCGKIDFKILCADHTLFPLLPVTTFDKAVSMDADLFQKMIAKTSFAVSSDTNRAVLTGVCWKIHDNEHLMAATDGRKVAEIKIRNSALRGEMTETNQAEDNIFADNKENYTEKIIPVKTLSFLQKIYDPQIKEMKLVIEQNKMMFAYGEYTIFTHIIEHKYPEYQKAFMHDLPNCLIIGKEALKTAIRRVALVAPDDNLRTRFEIEMDKFEINTTNRDTGDAKQFMDDYSFQGTPTTIAFNYKFMLSILDAIDTDKVKILLGSSKEPMMIYNEMQPENQEVTFLLMPLRS
ncbi:MAG TPA: DNA polymerase III subunit beta [Candidatus Cloacimonadota bacterium]|nr:DNA polymerase III subunit beta [Candidatus Cloacimonadota bacterium]HPS39534.1 DNA polymerase III subunit beta [Candidatus Cloacimonadota bacterium]